MAMLNYRKASLWIHGDCLKGTASPVVILGTYAPKTSFQKVPEWLAYFFLWIYIYMYMYMVVIWNRDTLTLTPILYVKPMISRIMTTKRTMGPWHCIESGLAAKCLRSWQKTSVKRVHQRPSALFCLQVATWGFPWFAKIVSDNI